MTPILVPGWLSAWVYAQMLNYGFPTANTSERAPVVFCYHQYGFPQQMDRVLDTAASRRAVLIEDCAHAADSLYNGHPLGSMGEFSVFSFSKFAFCFALGGILAKDLNFSAFVLEKQKQYSRTLRFFINGFKAMDERNNGRPIKSNPTFYDGLRGMAYSNYGNQHVAAPRAISLWLAKRDAELQARRENFALLRSQTETVWYLRSPGSRRGRPICHPACG